MFKKLKDKIAEEVKDSPLKKVQQLAQAVVSPTSSSVFEPSSSNDKFCIDEGDVQEEESASQPKLSKSEGFTSVALTGQTNSPQSQKYGAKPTVAPETDNLFPKFEPQPTNFHVQSDWESASEVEDRGGQLEHISKESIYEAYRKVHAKYNRMRNKYHELVTHYRQLERENHKAKTVLSDTQDKALLRISELREQCQLEQQAKAHLEEALRNELEERDHIIKALRTKVQYLKSPNEDTTIDGISELPGEKTDNLIDLSENACVSKVPLPSSALMNKGSFDWFEEKLKECKELLNSKISKVDDLRIDLENARKQCLLTENSTNIGYETLGKDSCDSNSDTLVYQSLIKLVYDLGKEVKTFQDKTCPQLINERNEIINNSDDINDVSLKSLQTNAKISVEAIVKEGSDDGLYESANSLKVDQERQNDELKIHYDTIKNLQTKNETLNRELLEECSTVKEARDKLEFLNKAFDNVKKQVEDPNQYSTMQSFSMDSLEYSSANNNDLLNEVNQSIANFMSISAGLFKVKELNSNLEDELRILKIKLKESDDHLMSSNKESEEVRRQLECSESKINNLTGEQDSLNNKISELLNKIEKERADMKEKVSQLEATVEKKNIEKMSLAEKSKQVYDELSSVKKEYDDLINERKDKIDLENKFKQLTKDYEVVIEQNNGLMNEVLKLQTLATGSEEENKKLEDTVQADKEAYDKARSVLENKILCLETVVADYEKDKKSTMDELYSQNNELSNLKNENESLAMERAACVADFESKLNKFQEECTLAKELNMKLTNELSSLKEECVSLASEKNSISTKFSCLNEDMKNIENSLIAERAAKDKLNEDVRSVQEKYTAEVNDKKMLNDKINKLMHDYELVVKSENKLTLDIGLLKEELSVLEEKNGSLKQTINILKQDLLNKQTESFLKDGHKQKICDELESITLKNENLEETTAALKTKCLRLEENLKKSESDVLTLRKEVSSIEDENNTLKSNIELLTQQVNHKTNEIVTNNENVQSLLQELNRIKQERDHFECSLNSVQTKALGLEETLHSSEAQLIALRQAKEKCSEDITVLKSEFDMTSVQKESLQSKFDNLTNDFENLKNDHASLIEVNNQLSNDFSSYKRENNDIIRMFNETKQLLESEEKNVKTFKEEIKELAESLKISSLQMEEKSKELECLKIDVCSLTNQLNEANTLVEIAKQERSNLMKNVHGVHISTQFIKNDHQHLLDLVREFKSDLLLQLCAIKLIVENEMQQKVDVLHYKTDEKQKETDNKIKESNDDYNMKVKCLQDEKTEVEKKFKRAISIMESVRQFLFQISEEKSQSKNKIENFREIGKDFIKHLSAMEHFINENGKKQNNGSKDINLGNVENNNEPSLNNLPLNLRLETMCEDELDRFFGASGILTQPKVPKQKEGSMSNLGFKNQSFDENEPTDKEIDKLKFGTSIQDVMLKNDQYELETSSLSHNTCVDEAKHLKLEAEYKKLKKEFFDLQASYDSAQEQILDYERKLEEFVDETELLAMENLGKEQRNTISELKEQIENLQQDLENRGDAFEKLYEEHQESLKSQADEAQQLRQSYERDMREQDKKWRSCLDRRLAESDLRHQQLTAEWEAQRQELETASRLAVSAVESGSNSGDLLRKQIQALTLQLKNKRCDVCCSKKVSSEQSTRSIQDCTEMEYLRNIMYEYMMGKEPLVLSRVLCALMKFDDDQTKEIVKKEEHKITVFGQMGLL